MAETRALAAQAAHDVADLAAQEDRLDRDYRGGALPAERYARLVATVAEERAAAEANARRLTDRAAEVEAALANVDAESETLTRLAELRAAIAERVMDAPGGDIGALRAALAAVCAEVRLRTAEDGVVALDYIPHDDECTASGSPSPWSPTPTGANNLSGSGVPEYPALMRREGYDRRYVRGRPPASRGAKGSRPRRCSRPRTRAGCRGCTSSCRSSP